MAIDRNVTININDISPSANTAYVDVGKENKVYNKAQVNELVEDLREGTLGSISPSQSLEELNALEDGNYYGAESGTYAFGEVVPQGWQYRFNKVGNVWKTLTKVQIPMQDLTSLENRVTENENKVDDFIDNFSVEVDQVFDENSQNAIANKEVTPYANVLDGFVEKKYTSGSVIRLYWNSEDKTINGVTPLVKTNGLYYISNSNLITEVTSSGRTSILWKDIPLNGYSEVKISLHRTPNNQGGHSCFLAKKSDGSYVSLIDAPLANQNKLETYTFNVKEYVSFSMVWLNVDTSNIGLNTVFEFIRNSGEYYYEKIDVKNYVDSKNSSSFATPKNDVIDVAEIPVESTNGSFGTLYYPCLISTENIENPKGKYYLYFSSDHNNTGNGKIGMFFSDDLKNWNFYGDIIKTKTPENYLQPETPCVIWNSKLRKYLMYFHVDNDYGNMGYAQTTLIAESTDGLNFTYVKVAFNIPMNRMKGNGHNGYFIAQDMGGYFIGNSLFGGGDNDVRATHFSNDGLNWITHQRETQGWRNSQFFSRNGQNCCITLEDIVSEVGSGGALGEVKSFGIGYLDDNYRLNSSRFLTYINKDKSSVAIASVFTYIVEGDVYILYTLNKNKIYIKKLS
ncbi:hypothetical protein [Empedobacter brevis]|uniref:hypothetical protein n=1 Tax=Empedobacter brevis TaxID=247 RepID=UPI00289EB7EE|nr:hypothetical protein [Empedobacter brevis]